MTSASGNGVRSSRPTTTTQTVRLNGRRVRLVTRNGKVTATPAAPLEWELQAAQVRALRDLPEYVKTAAEAERAIKAGKSAFTLAADQNSAKRGPKARAQAMAAGMMPGEHDVRLYMWPSWSDKGGILGLIENKVGKANLEPSQVARHPLLAALGFTRQEVIRATSEQEAADKAVAVVRGWMAANDNQQQAKDKAA